MTPPTDLERLDDEELGRLSPPGDEPGFGAMTTERGTLPLAALAVRTRIAGLLAATTVRQTFVNAHDEPIEATYVFPLPDRAAVTDFSMRVGDRVVRGEIEERGKARETYDRAIRDGHRAAITEEERPGVFTIRVGNLMPGDRAEVALSMSGPLPFDDGEATFRFPLVVAPRYIPGTPLPGGNVGDGVGVDTDEVPDASRISPPVLLPGFPNPVRLSLEATLDEGELDVTRVRSSLHAIVETEEEPGVRTIRVRPGERLDRDFVLRFAVAGEGVATSLVTRRDETGDEGTFALTIFPPAAAAGEGPPRDLVLLLDRSGSMGGWKMVAARRAAARMVESLTDRDRFAVLAFDNRIETPARLGEGLVSATAAHRARAGDWLRELESRGGTEMAEPLDRGVGLLAAAPADRDRVLVLVTDGQVGNEDGILARIARRLPGLRVFTLGIDRAVNEAFLRRLADLGGGTSEIVESEERLDAVMDRVHRRISAPVLTGLSLTPAGMELLPDSLVPTRATDLFAGSPLVLAGRFRGAAGTISVKATERSGAAFTRAVEARDTKSAALASVWARAMIRELEDRYVTARGDADALEKRIVETSLRFRVLCRFTAFVAVDRDEKVNPEGTVHRIVQPVEAPSGWDRKLMDVMACAAPAGPPPAGLGAMRRSRVGDLREMPPESEMLPMPPSDECVVKGRMPFDAERFRRELRALMDRHRENAAALASELAEFVVRVEWMRVPPEILRTLHKAVRALRRSDAAAHAEARRLLEDLAGGDPPTRREAFWKRGC